MHVRALGRVRRAARRPLAAPHPQRRHADRRRVGADGGGRAALDADARCRSSTAAAVGPVNFLGQDLPSLGDDWTFETQFTVKHNGGWQHVGLMVWHGGQQLLPLDDHPQPGRRARSTSSSRRTTRRRRRAPASRPAATSTSCCRRRQPGDDQDALHRATAGVEHRRRAVPGRRAGEHRPTPTGSTSRRRGWTYSGGLQLNPAGGARRDAAGSRIGIITAGNFPGATGTFPVRGHAGGREGRLRPDHARPGGRVPGGGRRRRRRRRRRSTRRSRARAAPTTRTSR